MVMAVRCASCGAELAPGDLFCGECGTKVVHAPRHPRFEAVDRQFFTLKGKHASGLFSDEEYEAALKNLIIQDDEGRLWMIGAETGQWYYHDGQNWVAREPPGPAAPPLPRRRSPLVLAAGIAAIAILLCLGSIPIVWLAVPKAKPSSQLPEVAAVVTETPVPTPTPTAPPSPTRTPSPALQVGLLYSDDFSDPASGWETYADDSGEVQYEQDKLVLTAKGPDGFASATLPSVQAQDFHLSLEATLISDPGDWEYGLGVRYTPGNWYDFGLTADGRYNVLEVLDEEGVWLVDDTSSEAIKTSGTNSIEIYTDGPVVRFYVNGEQLAEIRDAQVWEGSITLWAYVFAEQEVKVAFDNLEVWGPTSSPGVEASPTPTESAAVTPSPTPTAIPTWTPTPLPPTSTPVPTPTASATPASVGCPGPWGNLLFFDDFGNPQSGWTRYRGEEYEHFYENGEFHFTVWRTNFTGNAWIQLGGLATHYRIEVQAWKVDGPDMNNYGLLFGGKDDRNYYTFRISDSGSYRVAKMVEGQWVELVAWTQTPLVNKGALNFLGLRAEGTQITVCLNGQALASVNDPMLKSGRVGVVAGTYEEPVHIHFDNFGVWKFD
jgi:hypothetical protein